MNENKNDIIYTSEDILKYFSGQLNSTQMHAMEKAALDDAFLAEAMEGYGAMKEEDVQSTLLKLKGQLATKSSNGKIVALGTKKTQWFRVAAAILLIGSIGVLTYQIIIKNKSTNTDNSFAKNDLPKSENKDLFADTISNQLPGDSISTNNIAIAPTHPDEINQNPVTVFGEKSHHRDSVNKQTPPPVNNDVALNDGKNLPKKENEVELGSLSSPNTNDNNSFQNKDFSNPVQRFSAQVLGKDNKPVPFANIRLKNITQTELYTDSKGNFNASTTDSVLGVEVRSDGYLPKTFQLQSNLAKNKIILSEGDATTHSKILVIKDENSGAVPADGWDKYETYLKNNIDIPKDVQQNNLHGDVQVSFDVQSNGNVTNAQVDQSLCKKCDRTVRKLIENGPKWKQKSGNANKASLKVRF